MDKWNEEFGILPLPNFMCEDDINNISNYILKIKDTLFYDCLQCNGSKAYNTQSNKKEKLLDELAVRLKPHAENIFNKKLLYAYTYARYYVKGVKLDKHTDKNSCEYSLSVSLRGSDNEPWSLFIKDDAGKVHDIQMTEGDAIAFSGTRLEHWRDECVKDWQIQIFFHYVDAQGEYVNDPDVNERLPDQSELFAETDTEELFWAYTKAEGIDNDICDYYINKYEKDKDIFKPAEIGLGLTGAVDKDVRNVTKYDLSSYYGITGMIVAAMVDANHQNWRYDIDNCSQSEYLLYPIGGKYSAHRDGNLLVHREDSTKTVRKLTGIVILNDNFEGGKFFIDGDTERVYPPQNKGDIIVFPSSLRHGCEPVTKGERHAVVAWMNGKYFR